MPEFPGRPRDTERAFRRVTIYLDREGQPLSGSVDFYWNGSHFETAVIGAGPFDLTDEFIGRLLARQPRQLAMPLE